MENKWYTVQEKENFYDDMTGKLVYKTPRTMVLEFDLTEKLGGVQRVQFWRKSLVFDSEY